MIHAIRDRLACNQVERGLGVIPELKKRPADAEMEIGRRIAGQFGAKSFQSLRQSPGLQFGNAQRRQGPAGLV